MVVPVFDPDKPAHVHTRWNGGKRTLPHSENGGYDGGRGVQGNPLDRPQRRRVPGMKLIEHMHSVSLGKPDFSRTTQGREPSSFTLAELSKPKVASLIILLPRERVE